MTFVTGLKFAGIWAGGSFALMKTKNSVLQFLILVSMGVGIFLIF